MLPSTPSPSRSPLLVLGLVALGAAVSAGSWMFLRRLPGDELPAEVLAELPRFLPVPSPRRGVERMETCEELSEEVAVELQGAARALEREDAEAVARLLGTGFRGHALAPPEGAPARERPLGSRLRERSPSAENETPVDAAGFREGLGALIAACGDVACARFDVDAAAFESGRPTWGRVELSVFARGHRPDGAVVALRARGPSAWVRWRGRWRMESLELEALSLETRPRPVFTEVTREAGLAHRGEAFDNDYSWNGAACGDVDGDGRWDLFVPGEPRSFLYLADPSGGFVEVAEAWGLARPGGGTGAVFFDYDEDGDADLAVADEGFAEDGEWRGNPLRLFRNEGSRFTEVGEELGLRRYSYGHSLTVLDYDGDGLLDLFVSNYGRFGSEVNNAWSAATNAQPNELWHNLGGERFEEVGARAGVADDRWTFAAAAADHDRDGDVDLYVANDFGRNALLENQGDGTFVDVSSEGTTRDLGYGMSASWSDLDGDGRLDLYVSNMGIPVARRILARLDPAVPGVADMVKMAAGNALLFRRDGGYVAAPPANGGTDGGWAWGHAPLDVDLDGRLDLFCTNGYVTMPGRGDLNSYYWRHVIASSIEAEREPSIGVREEPNHPAFTYGLYDGMWNDQQSFSGHERDRLWLGVGGGRFVDVSDASGLDSSGDGRAVVAADLDDDGDVDLFVHEMQGDRHHLFRNDLFRNDPGEAPARGVKVRLAALPGRPGGRAAVGAEVICRTPASTCARVLAIGASFLACDPPELVFGLGEAEACELVVRWPGRAEESFGSVPAGSRVSLREGEGRPRILPARPRSLVRTR